MKKKTLLYAKDFEYILQFKSFFYVTNKESKHSRKISAAQEDTDIDVAKSCLYIE